MQSNSRGSSGWSGVSFAQCQRDVWCLSKRLHQSDAGTDLYVGDDEGDVVIKFYEALAKKYGYTITVLKREEQVAYTQLFESVKQETRS